MVYLKSFVPKVECPTCGKTYYSLLRTCFHCGRKKRRRKRYNLDIRDFHVSLVSLFFILISYKISIIRDAIDIILFSMIFLSVGKWNYYFKKDYQNIFVLPLKLRLYLLTSLLFLALGLKYISLLILAIIFIFFLFTIEFIYWMESSAKDFNLRRIEDLTTIGDEINKKFHFEKIIYENSNKDISKYYYKVLWGLKKYPISEFIIKTTISFTAIYLYLLILTVGFMILFLDFMIFGIFSRYNFPIDIEWMILMIIFSLDCIESLKSHKPRASNIDTKLDKWGVIIKIIKKGSFIEYFFLILFGFMFFWFFIIAIIFLLVINNLTPEFNIAINLNLTILLALIVLCLYYLINLKNIITNFITNNEYLPKYAEFFTLPMIILPILYYINQLNNNYITVSILSISIISFINFIIRRYITHEMHSISLKTKIIFGITGLIFTLIISKNSLSFTLIFFLLMPLLLKIIQKLVIQDKVYKSPQKRYNLLWNLFYKVYIMTSVILIVIVLHYIRKPPSQDIIIIKILSLIILILMIIALIIGNTIRKLAQKKDSELNALEFKRVPFIIRICGIDGPFLKNE